MQTTQRTTRHIALLAGGVLAVSSLHPALAHADQSGAYKAGAVGLGAAAAALILKGKTLPGVLAGVGAYYAYKKSQDAKHDQNYAQYPDDTNTNQSADNNYARYPVDNGGYGNDANAGYDYNGDNRDYNNRDGAYDRNNDNRDGGYRTADNYPSYGNPANYPAGQTYSQPSNQTSQQQENPDASDYNYTPAPRDNSDVPNYGYRSFSQAHTARHDQ